MRPSDSASSIDELTTSVWLLAALAAASRSDALPEELGAVLGAAGYAEATPDGWRLLPAYRDLADAFVPQVAGILRQAADVAEGTDEEYAKDSETLRTEGKLSGAQMSRHLDLVANRLPDVRELLGRDAVRFLDVGIGIGGITDAVLRRIPNATATGLDIDGATLELARDFLSRQGLAERVELREQDVATLTDHECYDLVWLPLVALSPQHALAGLPRLRDALRPDGWLISAAAFTDADADTAAQSLRSAIVRWRIARRGVTGWDAAELAHHLTAVGFREVQTLDPEEPGMPLVVARA